MITKLLIVGAGGFFGASSRYLIGKYINEIWKGSFPMGTFFVNVLGSFLFGLIVFHPLFAQLLNRDIIVGIGVGFLGAFTTFSTFEYETLQLLEKGQKFIAVIYVGSSFAFGFGSAWLFMLF